MGKGHTWFSDPGTDCLYSVTLTKHTVHYCATGLGMTLCGLESAFHLLPKYPEDQKLSGCSFECQLYRDSALPYDVFCAVCCI